MDNFLKIKLEPKYGNLKCKFKLKKGVPVALYAEYSVSV